VRARVSLSLCLSLSLSLSLCVRAYVTQLEHERMSDGNSREADGLSRQSASPRAHLLAHFSGINQPLLSWPLSPKACAANTTRELAIPRKRPFVQPTGKQGRRLRSALHLCVARQSCISLSSQYLSSYVARRRGSGRGPS